MKEHNTRSFLSGVLVTLLAVGLIGTAAATVGKQMIEVDYKNITVRLNSKEIELTDTKGNTVEPFAYQGTTYVPLRAISSAFGANAVYAEIDGSGYINLLTPLSTVSALTPDYPFTGVPRLDGIVGSNAFQMSLPAEDGNTERTFYYYYKPYFKEGTADSYVSLYDTALKTAGFKLFQTSTVEGYPMYHYINDTTKVVASFSTMKINNAEYVSVLVNTEQQKKTTTGGSSTSTGSGTSSGSSSGSSNTSTPAPDNTAAYSAELSALDSAYSTAKAGIEKQYTSAYTDYMRALAAAHIGPDSPESAKLAVESSYQSARAAIDKQLEELDAKYSSDLAALSAKYGK